MFVLPLRAGLTFVNGLKSLNKINGPKINATIAKDKPPPNYIFSSRGTGIPNFLSLYHLFPILTMKNSQC
jgi:hypothetical protein